MFIQHKCAECLLCVHLSLIKDCHRAEREHQVHLHRFPKLEMTGMWQAFPPLPASHARWSQSAYPLVAALVVLNTELQAASTYTE